MATVLRPNSLFSGVMATERLTRSKKLTSTPTPSSTAMRQRRLVQRAGIGDSRVKGARQFAGSRTHGSFEFRVRAGEKRVSLAKNKREPAWQRTAKHSS